MKIVITGATGFIGSEIVRYLAAPGRGHEVRVLTRNPASARAHFAGLPSVNAFEWDAEKSVAPATALEGSDVVIHLAGENVGEGRWSAETKRRILDSRQLGTRNLVEGLNALSNPPWLISTSATGYYGTRGDEVLTEESARGTGFLSDVCQSWEDEARKLKTPKLTILRFGVVLSPGGGALGKLLPIFKAGVGGRIGDGKHWMPWIDRRDLISLLLSAAATPEKFRGVFNAVAPEAVTNAKFTEVLGSVLHRPTVLPVPAFALKFALGEMAEETILSSQRVTPARLLAQGYRFEHPTLRESLASLVVEVRES